MLTRKDLVKFLLTGMKTTFMKEFKTLPEIYKEVSTVTTSTKDKETYPWLGESPEVEEWVDERKERVVSEHYFEIINRSWANTIALDRDALDDEQYSQIPLRAKGLAKKFASFFNKAAFTLIAQGNLTTGTSGLFNGKTISGFDAKAFFASDHPIEHTGSTQSNTGSTALSYASVVAARTAMMKMKDDYGEPMEVDPNLLVVPVDLYDAALKITGSSFDPSEGTATSFQAKNNLSGIKVIKSAYLTDTNNWFLFDTNNSISKPVIVQERKKLTFSSLTENTEAAFLRKKLYFGVDARYGFGFGNYVYGFGAIVT